jgi:hypothetical protein
VAPYNNANDVQFKRHWTFWSAMLGEWLEEHAKTGLLGEVESPHYGAISLQNVVNLADLPIPELARIARSFLDLYMHDVAHGFNTTDGTSAVAGARAYQWDPDGPIPGSSMDDMAEPGALYAHPQLGWVPDWTYLYAWHDNDSYPTNRSEAAYPRCGFE